MTIIRKIAISLASFLLLYAALIAIAIVHARAGDWRREAFGSGNYITSGYSADLPSRRQAYRRSTVTHIPVTRYRRVRIVPEHYETVHRHRRRGYRPRRHHDHETRNRCLSRPVHVWSGQHQNRENAEADAKLRWAVAAQSEHGNVYMSFPLAANPTWRCFQTMVPDTVSGKAVEVISKFIAKGDGYHMACELWATPCAAPIERGN